MKNLLTHLFNKIALGCGVLTLLFLAPSAHAQSCMWSSYSQHGDASLDLCTTTLSGLTANYQSTNPSDTMVFDDSQADSLGLQNDPTLGTVFFLAVYSCPGTSCTPSGADASGVIYTSVSQLCANSGEVAALGAAALCQSGGAVFGQGRLTLTSNTPVMTSDVTNATAVYYTPYIGNSVPIYSTCCSGFGNYTFSQLTMTLNSSNQVSGDIYDLFVFNNSGTITIGAGPAWSSSTSRGTGSGTTQLTQLQGIWVNANPISLSNGSTSYSGIAANAATYLGSVYITTSGETSMQFKPGSATGGSNNVLGLWNAYNRARAFSLEAESAVNWTYSTNVWEPLNNSNFNRVTYVDGLGQSTVEGKVTSIAYNATNGNGTDLGVGRDSISASPNVKAAYQSGSSVGFGAKGFSAVESFAPAAGIHYLQAMQLSPNSTTSTIAFNGGQTYLLFEGEY